MARLFGTDGVRGIGNRDLTPELALAIGRASVVALGRHSRPTFVLGRDTRASGPMLQAALSAGISSAGGDVVRLGVVPTPAVAFVTQRLGAAVGAVVSASHNPPEDNGIKLFGPQGTKLPDATEDAIERLVLEAAHLPRPEGGDLGRVEDAPEEVERYLEHLLDGAEGALGGMRVVIDCANGAAFRLGPEVLRRLGADVVPLFDEPDGTNINVGCGATAPARLAEEVRRFRGDAGVAFDGDADRAIFVDSEGVIIDGDQVIAACALALKEDGRLPNDMVVVTVMANLGFRRAMEAAGISVSETPVGDRYVLEEMERTGAALGGEQSGHVIFRDHATTGDGLLTAVRFLSLAARRGSTVADLAAVMDRFPQVLENVRVDDPGAAASSRQVVEAVAAAELALGSGGRVLVRPSGTEAVVRVMVEAESEEVAREHARAVAEVVATAPTSGLTPRRARSP